MPIMKIGKRESMIGIEQSNQECIRTLDEKEYYKYLGILEADTIKQAGMKGKRIYEKNEKASLSQALQQKSCRRDELFSS